jgi:hypothetical protein
MKRKTLMVLEVIFAGVGYGLLVYQTNWKVCLAIFILIWANNLGHSCKINRVNH